MIADGLVLPKRSPQTQGKKQQSFGEQNLIDMWNQKRRTS